jgi:hypothetical protein
MKRKLFTLIQETMPSLDEYPPPFPSIGRHSQENWESYHKICSPSPSKPPQILASPRDPPPIIPKFLRLYAKPKHYSHYSLLGHGLNSDPESLENSFGSNTEHNPGQSRTMYPQSCNESILKPTKRFQNKTTNSPLAKRNTTPIFYHSYYEPRSKKCVHFKQGPQRTLGPVKDTVYLDRLDLENSGLSKCFKSKCFSNSMYGSNRKFHKSRGISEIPNHRNGRN